MIRGPDTAEPDGVDPDDVRERLVVAALRVAAEHGLAELTVRRIADAAGTSTMSVYSRFGGRAGVLEALYRRAFAMLGDVLAAVPRPSDNHAYLIDLAMAYRSFALESPPRYSFMFGHPLADFAPGAQLRAEALPGCFGPLVAAVRVAAGGQDAMRPAYFLWCVLHGMIGLELADILRTPLPGWGVGTPDDGAGERMYLAGVRAMLVGLGLADDRRA
ncbi:MAG TPA: TetR/AcrR family transcriptional regulator [Nakamurella sp.]